MNAFGIPTASGEGTNKPFFKYNTKSGRFSKADRVQTADGWKTNEIDLGSSVTFAADLANVRIGWMHFQQGQAPRKVLVPFGVNMPPRPGDLDDKGKPAFKAGVEFDVIIQGEKIVRELSSNASTAVEAFAAAFEAFQAAPERNTGKVPVLSVTDTVPIKGAHGTNYAPKVSIVAWVDRPPILDTAPAAAAPVAQAAAHPMSPPPVSQAPAAAPSFDAAAFG